MLSTDAHTFAMERRRASSVHVAFLRVGRGGLSAGTRDEARKPSQ